MRLIEYRKGLIGSILYFLVLQVQGQNEANIWYFGDQAGIDFNSGVPEILLDGQLDTNEGCATISDTNGDLLFYTDGRQVYNKNHVIMPNGNNLKGDSSSTHSAIIVPNPSNNNIYYIFTVDEEAGPDGLNFSEIDIQLNGGLGNVTSNKNILLATPTTEKLTAISNSTGDGFWVVSHSYNSDEFLAYQITDAGVSTVPIVSAVGTFVGGNDLSVAIGAIKVSPDGSKLAVARGEGLSELQLFDFNTASGSISNPITILDLPNDQMVYGVEFSPNSKLLYVSVTGNGIFQYNLLAGNTAAVIASQFEITTLPRPYAGMQLGPDGRIYIAKFNQPRIDYIEEPNSIGAASNFQFEALELNGAISKSGLPPFIQSFFIIGFNSESFCLGEATAFEANISQPYDSLEWNFGDGSTSTDENPSYTYLTAGVFTVTLEVFSNSQSAIESQEITIYEQPTAFTPPPLQECDDDNDGLFTFNLTSQNGSVLNGQNPAAYTLSYYSSLSNLNNDIELTTPSAYLNETPYVAQEIYVQVFNAGNLDCSDIASFDIQVFDSPNPSDLIPALRVCDDVSFGTDSDGFVSFDLTENESLLLNGLLASNYTITYFQDALLSIPITTPDSYVNTDSEEEIYVRIQNNENADCEVQTFFSIEVFELPTVNSTGTLGQCDDDTDGFSLFNLNEVLTDIVPTITSEVVTFHESELEAISGDNPILNVTAYENQTVSTDVVWARVQNENDCFRTSQINLEVATTQIPLNFTRLFYECDDAIDGTTTDGITAFDFSIVTQEIEAIFPSNQQLLITYYRNQSDALAESDPITDISSYRNSGYPATQDIYIRVDSAINNDCLGLGDHITLTVEQVPMANTVSIDVLCDEDGDGLAAFDTSLIEATILQGQTDVSVRYFDASTVELSSPLPNPFVTSSQIVTVVLENTSSQDIDGPCTDTTTLNFQVEDAVMAFDVPEQKQCDTDGDGLFSFDTTLIESTLLNGQSGLIVQYFDASGANLSSPLPNPFTTETQNIVARVENPGSSSCFDETTISFIVSEQPQAFQIANDYKCDSSENDGQTTFILSLYTTEILNGQSSNTFTVSYHASAENATMGISPLPNAYQNVSNPETIFARIENTQNDACFDVSSFEINVVHLPIAHSIEDIQLCDAGNDDYEILNLSNISSEIINGQTNTSISYHLTESEANLNENPQALDFELVQSITQLYARLESTTFPSCYTTTSFNILLREQPVIDLQPLYFLCDESPVILSINSSYDYLEWSTGETSSQITIKEPGSYSVEVINTYTDFECTENFQFQVLPSGLPSSISVEVEDFSDNDNSISLAVDGDGDYEYSLNFLNWQDEPFFDNVSYQESYNVFVRDKNGCGFVIEEVFLLNAPTYFTPNADGFNDYWNVYNFERESAGRIWIFDRYGKELISIKAGTRGWDGIYNGQEMPPSDYWFRLERGNGKVHLGHFSLLR